MSTARACYSAKFIDVHYLYIHFVWRKFRVEWTGSTLKYGCFKYDLICSRIAKKFHEHKLGQPLEILPDCDSGQKFH